MRAALAISVLLLSGCASVSRVAPVDAQAAHVRRQAERVTDAVTAALGILTAVGARLDALPLAAPDKDRYDCAVLTLTGTHAPVRAAVTRVCGAVPTVDTASLPLALAVLQDVTTCAGLTTAQRTVIAATQPVVAQLEQSGLVALQLIGASLRVTLAPVQGVTCET